MVRWTVATLCIVGLALSGCSAPEPTGKLESMNYATPAGGTITIFYQPFDSGGNPATGTAANQTQCAQDSVPGPIPGEVPLRKCKGPYSVFAVSIPDLPDAGSGTYGVFLARDGVAPFSVGTLMAAEGSNATVAINVTQDLTGKYDRVEVRLDDFLYSVATAAAGTNTFALAPGVNGVTVTGTFVGRTLDVQVNGLPASNGTYMANLYLPGAATPSESFDIPASGTLKIESKQRGINEYGEFHVHVGGSKLNIYKAAIKTDG